MIKTSTSDINIITPFAGQQVSGWVTSTQTDTDGIVLYGPFGEQQHALDWATQLINAVVYPIYYPAYNAG